MKMKKLIGLLLVVAMLVSAVSVFAACQETYEIAVVTDVGQLLDKGFNQGTYEGAKKYAEDHGKTYKYYQPANGAEATDNDRVAAMNAAIEGGAKVIVTPGFLQATALFGPQIDPEDSSKGRDNTKSVVKNNPDVKFIFIDGWNEGYDNLVSVTYKEQESGYFAGYAAVMEGYTKLGYTGGGGGTNPACNRFGYGYVQGAEAAAIAKGLTEKVQIKYSYKYGSTFSASPELKTQISGWYNAGTEVVFACGGSMFSSVKEAAGTTGKIIGVDVDQSGESRQVITSAIKGLSESVQNALDKLYTNKWSELNGALVLGAKENSTGIPTETWRLENWTVAQYQALFTKVANGEVQIKSEIVGTINQAWFNALELTKVTVQYE